MGDLGPALDLAHRHDVDAVLLVADREADGFHPPGGRRAVGGRASVVVILGGGTLACDRGFDAHAVHSSKISHANAYAMHVDCFSMDRGPSAGFFGLIIAGSPITMDQGR